MSQIKIDALGDESAARRIERVGVAAHMQRATMGEAARATARNVKGVPRDTGRLASSIEPLSVTPYGFSVGSRVPYARYVFHGTRYMAARPPTVPDSVASRTAAVLSGSIARA